MLRNLSKLVVGHLLLMFFVLISKKFREYAWVYVCILIVCNGDQCCYSLACAGSASVAQCARARDALQNRVSIFLFVAQKSLLPIFKLKFAPRCTSLLHKLVQTTSRIWLDLPRQWIRNISTCRQKIAWQMRHQT